MSMLSFLKTAQVTAVEESASKGRGVRKQWNPIATVIAIRLWKDGSIFPSQAATDKFGLEYRTALVSKEPVTPRKVKDADAAKPAELKESFKKVYSYGAGGPGYGFDVIDSQEWGQFKADGRIVFVSPALKTEPKVDLFNTVNMEDGKPVISVMEQGSATFGLQMLIPMIEGAYGIKLDDTKEYVDLEIAEIVEGVDVTTMFSQKIMMVPKRVSRGADKGKMDYERRENQKVYALVPLAILEEEAQAETQKASDEQVAPK